MSITQSTTHSESLPSTCSSSFSSISDAMIPPTPEIKTLNASVRIHGSDHDDFSPLGGSIDDFHHSSPKFILGSSDEGHECNTVLEEDEELDQEPLTPTSFESHNAVFTLDSHDSSATATTAQPSLTAQQTVRSMLDMSDCKVQVRPRSVSKPPSPPTFALQSPTQQTPVRLEAPTPVKRSNTFSRIFHRSGSGHDLVAKLGMGHREDDLTPRQSPQPKARTGLFAHKASPVPSKASSPSKSLSPTNSLSETRKNAGSPPKSLSAGIGRLGRNRRSSSMNGIADMQNDCAITHPAETGVGLKARKLSTAVPMAPTFKIHNLGEKYANKSHIPLKSKQIGEGASAIVKLMSKVHGNPSELFAVKEFRKKSHNESEEEYTQKLNSEFCLSKSLVHPNIVLTEDLCRNNGRWCHVMEYCSGGDLFSIIKKNFMGAEEKLCIFKQLLRGVAYLHSHGVAHRDIKPENLLLCSDGRLKISDFGISEVFSGDHPAFSEKMECGSNMDEVRLSRPGICGSKPYLSPEVITQKDSYDARKLDVWSCAIVYVTLHYGGFPWAEASSSDRMYAAYRTSWDKWLNANPSGVINSDSTLPTARIFGDMKPPLKRLLYRMAHPDPEKRITIEQAVNDRWMNHVECCIPDSDYDGAPCQVDCGQKNSCKLANKIGIKKLHQHLPPKTPKKTLHHEV
ncbi:hypothetical protein H072_8493 [Dactylellina haptotyla CBS 200.50]|uniref:non-specific serine/threonine protein kinase n=1 Tax=Dactylellina haptotyla (strain CBS 200.50) TaxID=1284197 RepID=S8BRW4_DACHA|nr:hypothetical protein H072_8493 [Dactylellina haptotyla CBS 200.50]